MVMGRDMCEAREKRDERETRERPTTRKPKDCEKSEKREISEKGRLVGSDGLDQRKIRASLAAQVPAELLAKIPQM